ncbi:MAG: sulfite exporter TauE/SafE family protein, partial [Chloroflexi bacterium]|nr:sulfite exporter TauE/SafE family protein [Chloroflexota bacterium]
SVLGIGGGLFIIPSLNLFLGVELKHAIAASIVAVIATSLGGGNVYLRRHVADMRLGLILALATAPAAVVGALLATRVSPRVLAAVFALILAVSAYRMARGRRGRDETRSPSGPRTVEGKGASRLHFRGRYSEADGSVIPYQVCQVPYGVAASSLAGLISGLLGVGGGIVQVPVMNLIMQVPIKVATTTSTYVIGITAMAGAFVYYNHRPSFVDPALAVPVTIGVFLGASFGSRALGRLSPSALRTFFILVLAVYTVQMVLRVFGIGGG